MSVKFRLIKRKNLGKDKVEIPEKMYAQPVYSDLVSFEEILQDIVESGIPTNQVKGVADRMNHLIRKNLAAGRRVQFGELGNFRYGVGSTGSVSDEEFDSNMIKTPKIVFSPGSTLRKARKNAEFAKYVAPGTPATENPESGEKPDDL